MGKPWEMPWLDDRCLECGHHISHHELELFECHYDDGWKACDCERYVRTDEDDD